VLELLHTPPATPSVSVIAEFTHTAAAPEIVPEVGNALTVIAFVAVALPQLAVVALYEMVTAPPDTPVTTPVLLTVARAVLELLHTPVEDVSESVIVEPTQTDDAPEIAPASGRALTVTALVTVVVPQLLVTP